LLALTRLSYSVRPAAYRIEITQTRRNKAAFLALDSRIAAAHEKSGCFMSVPHGMRNAIVQGRQQSESGYGFRNRSV
jgi:hypothetical protein